MVENEKAGLQFRVGLACLPEVIERAADCVHVGCFELLHPGALRPAGLQYHRLGIVVVKKESCGCSPRGRRPAKRPHRLLQLLQIAVLPPAGYKPPTGDLTFA